MRKALRPSPAALGRPWFEIKAASTSSDGDHADIYIFDEIGDSWWSETTSASDFVRQLRDLGDVATIDLHLNSPGGSIFDGVAIYNLLVQHKAKVTTYVDGHAASIASVIALAGDEVVMAENAMMMIHNPLVGICGYYNANELLDLAGDLDKIRQAMMTTYLRATSRSEEELVAALDAETWLTAAEAVEWGFADRVNEPVAMAALARFDFGALGLHPPTGPAASQDSGAPVPAPEPNPHATSPAAARADSGDASRKLEGERTTALVSKANW